MIGKLVITLSFLLVCASCAQESVEGDAFAETYAAAEMALAEAEASRNVWSKTETILLQSKAAYDDGRTDEAIELAAEAKLQAELALEQAVSGKEAWKANVLSE